VVRVKPISGFIAAASFLLWFSQLNIFVQNNVFRVMKNKERDSSAGFYTHQRLRFKKHSI
jgi:hypothetical protein